MTFLCLPDSTARGGIRVRSLILKRAGVATLPEHSKDRFPLPAWQLKLLQCLNFRICYRAVGRREQRALTIFFLSPRLIPGSGGACLPNRNRAGTAMGICGARPRGSEGNASYRAGRQSG